MGPLRCSGRKQIKHNKAGRQREGVGTEPSKLGKLSAHSLVLSEIYALPSSIKGSDKAQDSWLALFSSM